MNPIQRAWLKVLGPVAFFVNERLAPRAGSPFSKKHLRAFFIGSSALVMSSNVTAAPNFRFLGIFLF